MNGIQSLIDRQLGIYCRLNYDNILKRLVVNSEESFYGLQSAGVVPAFEQDPPIFACRFAETAGYEHILAIANEDGRVAIQNTSRAASARSLDGFQCHNNAVFDLAWMPGNMNFVTVSGDHTACLWDANEGAPRQVLVFSSHTRSVKTAVFPPGKRSVFATGARDGHILIWDVRASGRPAVVLKPDDRLLSCHSSFAPKTPGSHGKRPRIDPRATSITGLAFRDELTLLSSGECDGNIKAWDLRKNYSAYAREPLPMRAIPYCGSSTRNGYTNLIVDDAGVRLYASCMDGVIYCFNVAAFAATPERRYVGHENSTFYIKTCLSPDGEHLVSGSSDKNAYVWSARRSEPVAVLRGHRAEVTCVAWCRRGDPKLVTCSDDARHMLWRIGPEAPAPEEAAEYCGRAESPPRARPGAAALPPWGALDRTPTSLKRKAAAASCDAKRMRPGPSARRTKRCLADLMNASGEGGAGDAEGAAKRPRPTLDPEERLLPAGIKRRISESSDPCGSPSAGPSLSTRAREARSPDRSRGSPELTPPRVRIVAFGTPTKDLPNFVVSGEAPHLRLMSPAKKKRDRPNWLARLGQDRRRADPGEKSLPEKSIEKVATEKSVPASPSEGAPSRRSSVSDRTPRSNKKAQTLLKYFNVATKK